MNQIFTKSDNLKQAIIDGFSVVVNKNDVNEGDYMIYCKNETELNSQFLSVNNMYGERYTCWLRRSL